MYGIQRVSQTWVAIILEKTLNDKIKWKDISAGHEYYQYKNEVICITLSRFTININNSDNNIEHNMYLKIVFCGNTYQGFYTDRDSDKGYNEIDLHDLYKSVLDQFSSDRLEKYLNDL